MRASGSSPSATRSALVAGTTSAAGDGDRTGPVATVVVVVGAVVVVLVLVVVDGSGSAAGWAGDVVPVDLEVKAGASSAVPPSSPPARPVPPSTAEIPPAREAVRPPSGAAVAGPADPPGTDTAPVPAPAPPGAGTAVAPSIVAGAALGTEGAGVAGFRRADRVGHECWNGAGCRLDEGVVRRRPARVDEQHSHARHHRNEQKDQRLPNRGRTAPVASEHSRMLPAGRGPVHFRASPDR